VQFSTLVALCGITSLLLSMRPGCWLFWRGHSINQSINQSINVTSVANETHREFMPAIH
jgi:hypothetical protein